MHPELLRRQLSLTLKAVCASTQATQNHVEARPRFRRKLQSAADRFPQVFFPGIESHTVLNLQNMGSTHGLDRSEANWRGDSVFNIGAKKMQSGNQRPADFSVYIINVLPSRNHCHGIRQFFGMKNRPPAGRPPDNINAMDFASRFIKIIVPLILPKRNGVWFPSIDS